MRTSLLDSPPAASHWEPKLPFDLVIAYEDLATRNRAMRLHDHLARQLSDDFDVRCAWWKLQHLADPTLREHATDDASTADMIVISVHAGTQLPPAAQRWIESWSHPRDHRKCALVTLFVEREAPGVSSALVARLQQVARVGRMDFFTNLPAPGSIAPDAAAGRMAERARVLPPALDEILQERIPSTRSGINEA